MTKTNKFLLVALIATLLGLFLTDQARRKAENETKDIQSQYEFLNQTHKELVNRHGRLIEEQKTAQTTSESQIKDLSAKVFDLTKREERRIKQVEALIRIAQNAGIRDVMIPYKVTDTVQADPSDSLIAKAKVVIPPKQFADSTEHYSINGTVLLEGVRIDSLDIPDSLSLRIAQKKEGLFKPKQQVIQIIHSNPLVKTTGLNSLTLKQKPTAWNRVIKPALGVIAGVLLAKSLR